MTFRSIQVAHPHQAAGRAPGEHGRGPRRIDLDEVDMDLPDEGSTDETSPGADDEWRPDDDSDLGLADDESEDVGLDTSTGLDDGLEPDGELDEAGEGVRWTTDSEADDDLPGADADLLPGAEYGWLGDEDPPEEADDFDPGIEDDALPAADDGGAEGVDDDTELDDFDLGALPDIDADAEEDADGLGAEALEELADVALSDEASVEVAGGVVWKMLSARAWRSTLVAELATPPRGLAAHGGWVVGCNEQVWQLDDTTMNALPELRLEPTGVLQLALYDHAGRSRIAVASGGHLRLSSGGGVLASAQPSLAVRDVGFTSGAHGARLWVQTEAGALAYSDDDAATFAELRLPGRVQNFATDGRRRVIALCAGEAGRPSTLAHSSDSGRHFGQRELNIPELQHDVVEQAELQVCRDALALITPQAVLCASAGGALAAPLRGLSAPAMLADEDDDVILYACVRHAARVSIVRHALRDATLRPTVVASLELAQTGEPRWLTAMQSEGLLTLHLATDRRIYRIEASLDGDTLA